MVKINVHVHVYMISLPSVPDRLCTMYRRQEDCSVSSKILTRCNRHLLLASNVLYHFSLFCLVFANFSDLKSKSQAKVLNMSLAKSYVIVCYDTKDTWCQQD